MAATARQNRRAYQEPDVLAQFPQEPQRATMFRVVQHFEPTLITPPAVRPLNHPGRPLSVRLFAGNFELPLMIASLVVSLALLWITLRH